MHLHEMHIGARREGWMLFQGRAQAVKVHLRQVSDLDHRMGIAHANGNHLQWLASHLQFTLRQRSPSRQVGGDRRGLQKGSPISTVT